jgi:hypothetical protein
MWGIIRELDQRLQLQVVNVVLDTQIAIARAHVDGLQNLKKTLGGIKASASKT